MCLVICFFTVFLLKKFPEKKNRFFCSLIFQKKNAFLDIFFFYDLLCLYVWGFSEQLFVGCCTPFLPLVGGRS
ncbi:MAG: hypothetical protein D3916_04915 [Candidatus Electrothrix sp. MAN1_4]|nr:hypothetical protein [Candidatus Electrothrix sp. MAN1_4]